MSVHNHYRFLIFRSLNDGRREAKCLIFNCYLFHTRLSSYETLETSSVFSKDMLQEVRFSIIMENLLICLIVVFAKENKKSPFVWRYVVGYIMPRTYYWDLSRKAGFPSCNNYQTMLQLQSVKGLSFTRLKLGIDPGDCLDWKDAQIKHSHRLHLTCVCQAI